MTMDQRLDIGLATNAPSIAKAAPRLHVSPVFLLVLVVVLALPFAVKGFVVFQLTMVMIYAIAIMGLNLLTGFNGQFSLGHGAFFAVGAYTAAIMMDRYDIGFAWTLPVAALAAFFFGMAVGLPALRLENIYLALATFSLAAVTPGLLKLAPFEGFTGGVQGIVVLKPDAPFALPLTQDQWLYYIAVATGLVLYAVAVNIVRSRTGRAVMAIRENPIAARAMGINTAWYKTLIFGVSAMFTGVAGALSAVTIGYVAPDSFTVSLSIALLVGLVVGGVAWLPGALIGGLFVLFVPNIADEVSKGLSGAVYGVILLAIIYLMPSGAGAIWRAAEDALSRRRKQKS
jgi:branched-chain amino acid transport system permease protein